MSVRLQIFNMYRFHAEHSLYVYDLHYKNALEYFKDRPDDLLILNIPAGDGWKPLCDFLNIDWVPDKPFPRKISSRAPGAS